jgi:hypothetical protein
MNEQEKKWSALFAKALDAPPGHINVRIDDRPDGWVTVSTLGTPAYKARYVDNHSLAELATQLARERVHTLVVEHEEMVAAENQRRQARLSRILSSTHTLAEVISEAHGLTRAQS